MPKFSHRSEQRLLECHPLIQEVMNEAIKYVDFMIVCGYRGKEDQDRAYREGKSNVTFPNSKHNSAQALAVDICPYPTLYSNEYEFWYVAGVIMCIAKQLQIPLRWGGRWKTLRDTPHFELEI